MFSVDDIKKALSPKEAETVLYRLQALQSIRKEIETTIDSISTEDIEATNLEFLEIKALERDVHQRKLNFYNKSGYMTYTTGDPSEGNQRTWRIHPAFYHLRDKLEKDHNWQGYSDETLKELPPWAIVEEPDDNGYSLFARKIATEPQN